MSLSGIHDDVSMCAGTTRASGFRAQCRGATRFGMCTGIHTGISVCPYAGRRGCRRVDGFETLWDVHHHLDGIVDDLRAELRGDWCAVLHGRGGVDLEQPDLGWFMDV
jgi:hypothetical protein